MELEVVSVEEANKHSFDAAHLTAPISPEDLERI